MGKITTGEQAIKKIARVPGVLELATIISVNILSRDSTGVILSVSPIITVNIHGIGGLDRVELSAGIDPRKISVGDEIFVTYVRDRYVGVGLMPSSNRTAAGSSGLGAGSALDYYSSAPTVTATIVGSQLELLWAPVVGAEYYEVWASPTGTNAVDDSVFVAFSPTTAWVSKRSGQYFDDGMYYAIAVRRSDGKAGPLSAWVKATFGGNYATGFLSKNQTTVIPGSMMVSKAGSITRADFTSVDSPTTFTIDICDPMAAHSGTPLFANSDILQFTDTSGNKLWVTVSSSADMTTYWTYTVVKSSPGAGTNYTILSGSMANDVGQSGQGLYIVSADGTYGASTLWEIVTHAGAPWTTLTKQVYADSTGKLLAGGGVVVIDANGVAFNVGTAYSNAYALRWLSSGTQIGYVGGWNDPTYGAYAGLITQGGNLSEASTVEILANSDTGHKSLVYIHAGALPGDESSIRLSREAAGSHVISILTDTMTMAGESAANVAVAITGSLSMSGGAISNAMDTMTYASTISLNVSLGNMHKTTTVNATGNATINASGVGTAGQQISVLIINDATSGKTITFGTNFKPSATVVGTVSKAALVTFWSDGINWYEASRTLNL